MKKNKTYYSIVDKKVIEVKFIKTKSEERESYCLLNGRSNYNVDVNIFKTFGEELSKELVLDTVFETLFEANTELKFDLLERKISNLVSNLRGVDTEYKN